MGTFSVRILLRSGECLVVPDVKEYSLNHDIGVYMLESEETRSRMFFNMNEVVYLGREHDLKKMTRVNGFDI